jgi:phage baseplate assembly protein W
MARTIYQYKPYNDRPDKAIGILLPFNKNSSGRNNTLNYSSGSINGGSVFVQSYTTEHQSISNLKNLLLTKKGERFLQPRFGTDIQSILFEQNTEDTANALRVSLEADIAYWLPYITINNIEVLRDPDRYTFLIRITFFITNVGANLVINVLANENGLTVTEDATNTKLSPVGFLPLGGFNGIS